MTKDKQLTAAQVAEKVGGELVGNADARVHGVESLMEARADQLSFLGNPKYANQVVGSAASVVLVPNDFEETVPEGRAWILCDNPSDAFSTVIDHFAPAPPTFEPGVHPAAVVADTADIAESASIGPCAVIEPGASVGENTVIGAGCYIGHETSIGADCHLYPNVSIRERCRLGDRIIIHSGAVIGSDGFGFIPGPDGHKKIPQVGIVQIDDDVEIGAQVAIDRARFGKTWIKRGTKIDNLAQIAHNVVVGEHCFLVAQCGIAGSARLGRGVIVAGQSGVAGHITLGDGVVVLGQSGAGKDTEPGKKLFGIPAVEQRDHVRREMYINQLPRMKKDLKELQKQLQELQSSQNSIKAP